LTTGRQQPVFFISNQTPAEWFSKRVRILLTATFAEQKTAPSRSTTFDTYSTDGYSVDGTVYMFGDNQRYYSVDYSTLFCRRSQCFANRVRSCSAGVIYSLKIDKTLRIVSRNFDPCHVVANDRAFALLEGETTQPRRPRNGLGTDDSLAHVSF
jgi:hypothetical protein